jgi:hypothetical protein
MGVHLLRRVFFIIEPLKSDYAFHIPFSKIIHSFKAKTQSSHSHFNELPPFHLKCKKPTTLKYFKAQSLEFKVFRITTPQCPFKHLPKKSIGLSSKALFCINNCDIKTKKQINLLCSPQY